MALSKWKWLLEVAYKRLLQELGKLGASITHASPSIKNYMGFGLFPIAGVTIGLAMLIKRHPAFANIEPVIINAILASVIINEIIAPPLTKLAIFRAKEAYKRN